MATVGADSNAGDNDMGMAGGRGAGSQQGIGAGGDDRGYRPRYKNPAKFGGTLFSTPRQDNFTAPQIAQFDLIDDFLNKNFINDSELQKFTSTPYFDSQQAYESQLADIERRMRERKIAGETLIDRYNKANAYNDLMRTTINMRDSYNTGLGQMTDWLAGADINDYEGFEYSGPTMTELQRLVDLSTMQEAPVFTDPEGIDLSGFTGTPELLRLGEIDPLTEQYEANQIALNSLGDRYDIALDEDTDYLRELQAQISRFKRETEGADIYDAGYLDDINRQFGDIQYMFDVFDPALESSSSRLSPLQEQLDALGGYVGETRDLVTGETQRLADYIDQFNRDYTGLSATIGDLGIGDLEGINASDQQVSDLLTTLLGFETPLSFDPSAQVNLLTGLDDRLDTLLSNREAEQGRIESFRSGVSSRAQDLLSAAEGADPYTGDVISQLRYGLNDLTGELEGFQSPLDFSFDQTQSTIGDVDAMLADLIAQRRSGIEDIGAQIGAALAEGQGAELYDERAILGAQREIDRLVSQLANYSGSVGAGLADARVSGSSALSDLDARLAELSDYRFGIEDQAQDLLSSLDPAALYRLDDVQNFRDQLAPIIEERNLYDAAPAMDEIASIQSMLADAESRMKADAAAVSARDASEAERFTRDQQVLDQDSVIAALQGGGLSDEEYLALLGKVRDRDPQFADLIEQQYNALYV